MEMDKLRILAVDDSSISLAAIEQELKRDYEVIPVNSGDRAVQYVKRERPDLILLDIQMAQKDGIETLREIRGLEKGRDVPVIMLTSKQDKATVVETSKLGIYDYVIKPFKGEDLHKRIDRALKG
ncbi:MAG: response regulator [Lachnospiraceae bacterium]|nr:response regulator [Lachnospiraceae bacterium]MDE6983278.1 response regulator [Lachnospiraceae bacterium]MDE7031018.1 response regulator [Lachnospiraceae bacterium]